MTEKPQPTADEKLCALEDALGKLMARVGDLVSQREADRKDKRRSKHHADDDETEGEAEDPEDPMRQPGEPQETAADDSVLAAPLASRRDQRRADSVAEANAMGEFQTKAERVAIMHGNSIERPRVGETYRPYRARTLRQLQRLLPDKHALRRADFTLIKDEHAIEQLKNEVLQDVEKSAYDHTFNTRAGLQREVVRYDASGRKIIEFVGPVDAPNGSFAPFRAPPIAVTSLAKLTQLCWDIQQKANR
jgi:hypothetical protein